MNRIFFVISFVFFGLMNFNGLDASAPGYTEAEKKVLASVHYDILNDEITYSALLTDYSRAQQIDGMQLDLAREKAAIDIVHADNKIQIDKYTGLLYRDAEKTKKWADLYKTIAYCGLNYFFGNKVSQPNSPIIRSTVNASQVKDKAVDVLLRGQSSQNFNTHYNDI